MDVAIVGVGLHPFGRFGEVTGIEMGAIAIRRALADAGVEWRDIEFAFGGSYEVDNPDAVVALMGLTGIPFTDVYNGCATAASALTLAASTIRLGEHRLGVAVGAEPVLGQVDDLGAGWARAHRRGPEIHGSVGVAVRVLGLAQHDRGRAFVGTAKHVLRERVVEHGRPEDLVLGQRLAPEGVLVQ